MGKLWKLQLNHNRSLFKIEYGKETYIVEEYIKKEQIDYTHKEAKETETTAQELTYIIPETTTISYSCNKISNGKHHECNWKLKFKVNEKENRLEPIEIIDIECIIDSYEEEEGEEGKKQEITTHLDMNYKNGTYNYLECIIPSNDDTIHLHEINEDNPEKARKLIEKYVKKNIYFHVTPITELTNQ